ncbi:MAG TPA: AAA family ATPase, partial [Myxococcota bacterium]|nr:AAA family ATPase [Myxococcota bacterium]
MRIESIQLDGFAGLEGRREFGPGLNLVVGPNEAGKSRLVAAIHYGLCGRVKKRGRALDPLERYRPWDRSSRGFRLSLTLRQQCGHTLEVDQNLDEPGRSRVVDVQLGRDLTTELLVDRAPDASRLFGLDRDVVPRTLLVTQGDLLAVRDGADAMQSMLQRAATNGAVDETANSALARLEAFKAERIGTEHASSKRPLRVARDLESQLRRALDELRALHNSLTDERAALVKRRGELARLEAELEVARAREVRHEAARLERLCARLETIDTELARLAHVADLDGPEVEVEALLRLEREVRAVSEAAPPSPPTLPSPDSIEQELAALPPPPQGDRQPRPELERLEQALQLARAELNRHDSEAVAEVAPPAGFDAHMLRECARELALPAPMVPAYAPGDDPGRARLLSWVALTIGLITLGLGAGLRSWWTLALGLLVIGLAAGAFTVARRRQREGLNREAERRAAEADLRLHLERRAKIEALLVPAGLGGSNAVALEAA